jgi:hypothetical protein
VPLPNKRVQSTSCAGYCMEYHGQREPLKRRDVSHSGVKTVFNLISQSVSLPVVFYDGDEAGLRTLSAKIAGEEATLAVDLSAPECRAWRHYYSDQELNRLWSMLGLKFDFLTGHERLVEPATGRSVYFQPFLVLGQEVSVCFCFDEVSPGHYMYWLLGLLARPLAEDEFRARVKRIERYWSNGRRKQSDG